MALNVTEMHDPSRQYLLVCGGDGYQTQIVTGPELDEAWIGLQFSPSTDCPDDVRAAILEALHDEDNWQQCYEFGVTRFEEHFEDGYAEIILLTPNA